MAAAKGKSMCPTSTTETVPTTAKTGSDCHKLLNKGRNNQAETAQDYRQSPPDAAVVCPKCVRDAALHSAGNG